MALGLFGGSLSFDHRCHQWETFHLRLKQYCIANEITEDKDPKFVKRRAILITSLVEETFTVATNLLHPDSLESIDYPELIKRLSAHFTSKRCTFAERYKFYKAEQKPGEELSDWATRVRTLAKHCEFTTELESVTRDKFVLGLENSKERERLFTEDVSKLTFNKALELTQAVRCARLAAQQRGDSSSGGIEGSAAASGSATASGDIFLLTRAKGSNSVSSSAGQENSRNEFKKVCLVCGYSNHSKENCRFVRYKCKKCGEKGHLSKMCPKKRVKQSNYLASDLSCELEVDLTLKPDAKPIFFKPRPVPFALKPKVDEALDKLVEADVLVPVDHSDYATPIIPVLKPDGTVRICGDYSVTLNKILVVDQYPLPRSEELFSKLHGGEEFSKLDLSMAYWQLCLSNNSQPLTCINTHKGLFMFKRLVLGISPAPAIFQKTMERVLAGIEGVCIFQDDLLITAPDRPTHLKRLFTVLEKLEDAGFTLKKEKCAFFQKSVEYLGYVIDKNGIHTSPDKICAIAKAKAPTNISELKSFLGLVNYYRIFVPNISSLLNPLHNLLKNGVDWLWAEEHQKVFELVKKELQSDRVLAHFNPELKTILTVDASPYGLGAILSQVQLDGQEKVVSYASRSLTKSEKAYSQIHKEATAIIFGIKKYHQYLYGKSVPFTLRTDHKPLLSIFGNKKGIPEMAANRLQRYALFLTAYNYSIEYVRSADNVADYLSRSLDESFCADKESVSCVSSNDLYEKNSYLHFLMNDDNVRLPISLSDVRSHTQADEVIKKVKGYILRGWPRKISDQDLLPYFNCRLQLSFESDCLLRGHKVVIPSSLREKVLDELHSSHFGVVKTKAEARIRFWWPGIDGDIERKVGSCPLCFDTKRSPLRSPLAPWPLPARSWERVHIDLLTVLGKNYLIVVDAFSKWLECFRMTSSNSEEIICKLSELIGRFGLMKTLVSDNATIFTSELFNKFCLTNQIEHLTIAPYHPASNGQAENSVRTVKKAIKTLAGESSTQFLLHVKINKFLLDYRNTVHCSTGFSPAQLMLGRPLRSRLDLMCVKTPPLLPSNSEIQRSAKNNLLKKQILQCEHYGGKRRLQFKPGDEVLLKKHYNNGTKHTWVRGTITKKIGTRMYLVYIPDMDCVTKKHVDQMMLYRGLVESKTTTPREEQQTIDYSHITLPHCSSDTEEGSGSVSDLQEEPDEVDTSLQEQQSEETDEREVEFLSPVYESLSVDDISSVGEESSLWQPSVSDDYSHTDDFVTYRPHNRR